jgi:hypothetical protein
MNQNLILIPVLAQILLTLLVYVLLLARKSRAVKAREVDQARRDLHDDAWPDYVLQVNNNIRNQFQVPILFYVLCLSLRVMSAVDGYAVGLATAFVISRGVHAYVHNTSNYVPVRRRVFTAGVVLLAGLLGLTTIRAL